MSDLPPTSGATVPETTTAQPVATTASAIAPAVKKPDGETHYIKEKDKTPAQRAEDIAYTANHAVSCVTTDIFVVPTIAAGFKLGKVDFIAQATDYMRGEIIGDFTAVPLTVMTQRFFPGFMDMLSHALDPLAKPLFHYGSRKAAERWGEKHGLETTNQEVVDHAEKIYQREMQHLPLWAMWNAYAFPLSVVGQHLTGAEGGMKVIARNKVLGTVISNVVLLGWRALLPDKAEQLDRFNSKHLVSPVTRAFSSLFGVDKKTVENVQAQEAEVEHGKPRAPAVSWHERMKNKDEAQAAAAAQASI